MKSYPREFFNKRFSEHLFITKKAARKKYLQVFRRMDLKRGDIVLDIGCGQGGFLTICREKNVKAFGVDYSIEGLKVAKYFGSPNVIVGDACHLPIRNASFTHVNASQVIELLEEQDLAIEEALRVSRKGMFYIEMRNKDFLIFTLLRKVGLYKRFFTYEDLGYKEIKHLLTKHGLQIERIYKVDVFICWQGLLSFIKIFVLKILRAVLPAPYFFGISLVCKSREDSNTH